MGDPLKSRFERYGTRLEYHPRMSKQGRDFPWILDARYIRLIGWVTRRVGDSFVDVVVIFDLHERPHYITLANFDASVEQLKKWLEAYFRIDWEKVTGEKQQVVDKVIFPDRFAGHALYRKDSWSGKILKSLDLIHFARGKLAIELREYAKKVLFEEPKYKYPLRLVFYPDQQVEIIQLDFRLVLDQGDAEKDGPWEKLFLEVMSYAFGGQGELAMAILNPRKNGLQTEFSEKEIILQKRFRGELMRSYLIYVPKADRAFWYNIVDSEEFEFTQLAFADTGRDSKNQFEKAFGRRTKNEFASPFEFKEIRGNWVLPEHEQSGLLMRLEKDKYDRFLEAVQQMVIDSEWELFVEYKSSPPQY